MRPVLRYRTFRLNLLSGFFEMRLKNPFTYIGTKKAKNSHLKIKFFQKNLRAAETAPKREKKQVILLYRTAEDQTSNADNS